MIALVKIDIYEPQSSEKKSSCSCSDFVLD
jgi:hypothetical protein